MNATFNIKVSIDTNNVTTSFGSEKIEDMDTTLLASVLKVFGDVQNRVKKQVAQFLSAMRKEDKSLYDRVSQVGWSEKDRAFEVFFKDAGYRVMFPDSNWNRDLFALYDAIGKGFRKDLLCAGEVDMRFHGFAYIKNFDKRCING